MLSVNEIAFCIEYDEYTVGMFERTIINNYRIIEGIITAKDSRTYRIAGKWCAKECVFKTHEEAENEIKAMKKE